MNRACGSEAGNEDRELKLNSPFLHSKSQAVKFTRYRAGAVNISRHSLPRWERKHDEKSIFETTHNVSRKTPWYFGWILEIFGDVR